MTNNKSLSEIKRLYWEKHVDIDDYLDSVINGIIISDGHCTIGKFQTAISLTSKYEEYVLYFADILKERNISYSIRENYGGYRTSAGESRKFTSYTLRTSSYVEFRKYNIWYETIDGRRRKIIPEVIGVDPLMLLNWYLGDGALKKRNTSRCIEFGVYAFGLEEVRLIALKICKILDVYPTEVRVYKQKPGFIISISHSIVPKFLKLIGECPVKCFEYKWDLFNYFYDERNYLLRTIE